MLKTDSCKHCNIRDNTEKLCLCNVDPSLCDQCLEILIENAGCHICAYYFSAAICSSQRAHEENFSSNDKKEFFKRTGTHINTTMNWFDKMRKSDRWSLRECEKLKILGNITLVQYERFLNGDLSCFSPAEIINLIKRLCILLIILEFSYALAGGEHAYSLFSKPNSSPIFNGRSIKDVLLANSSIEQFHIVRKYLIDAAYF